MNLDLMQKRVSDTDIEKVKEVVERSSLSKQINGDIRKVISMGFTTEFEEEQLKTM